MCYSVSSSLKTTLISLFAIIYLLFSKIPYFQWIAILLIGWCGMQFAELLLWITNPKKCNFWNKIITLTLIPLALMLQPLGSLYGSLYVISWNKSSSFRKNFIIFYTFFIVSIVSFSQYHNITSPCSTITPKGHLNWTTSPYRKYILIDYLLYFIWGFIILLPIVLFWKKYFLVILLLLTMPFFAFIYGLYTDGKPSIWCYYTSYASIASIFLLFLHQTKIYRIIK